MNTAVCDFASDNEDARNAISETISNAQTIIRPHQGDVCDAGERSCLKV